MFSGNFQVLIGIFKKGSGRGAEDAVLSKQDGFATLSHTHLSPLAIRCHQPINALIT
jgi:hypothetical protein